MLAYGFLGCDTIAPTLIDVKDCSRVILHPWDVGQFSVRGIVPKYIHRLVACAAELCGLSRTDA